MYNNLLEIIKSKVNEKSIDEDHLIWYLMFCLSSNDVDANYKENHHILPKSLFKEYKNLNLNPWNSASMSGMNHFFAHYLLAKAIKSRSTRFAFNLMLRSTKGSAENMYVAGQLYNEFRELLSTDMSEINKGRKHSDATKRNCSERMRGKVNVRSKDQHYDSTHFRVDVSDERYLSGELVYAATGRPHRDSTKQLMSDNGIKGRLGCHNKVTKVKMFVNSIEDIPVGFDVGDLPETIKQTSERFSGSLYYFDPISKSQIRSKDGIPDDMIKGKIYFGPNGNPFNGVVVFKNFQTRKSGTMPKGTPYEKYCASPTSNACYVIGNDVTFNMETAASIVGCSMWKFRELRKNTTQTLFKQMKIAEFFLLDNYQSLNFI